MSSSPSPLPSSTYYISIMAKDGKDVMDVLSDPLSISTPDDDEDFAVKLQGGLKALQMNPRIHEGIPVKRITASRGVWEDRFMTITCDKQALFVTHKKLETSSRGQVFKTGKWFKKDQEKGLRHLDVADIDAWQTGVVGTAVLENAKEPIKENEAENLVTIFHHGHKSMSFQINDKNDRNALIDALTQLKTRYNLLSPWIAKEKLLLRYIYFDIDKNKSGTIDSKEFEKICYRVNLQAPSNLNKIYTKFAGGKGKDLSIERTCYLLQLVARGNGGNTDFSSQKLMPTEELWNTAFGEQTKEVSVADLLTKFLQKYQGEVDAFEEDAEELVSSLKSFGLSSSDSTINQSEFIHFLHSKYNDAYDPGATAAPTEKLDLPISCYWINTSHNTYLTGDQLKSKSSVEAYVNALSRGCKCLELDCWDGEVDKVTKYPVPVIFHGHTLTSKIPFRSVCLVVQNYLEKNPTTYPIILSLENHCTHPFQQVMADSMSEIFGDKLFVPSTEQFSFEDLPSPEKLLGMVIIKGKRPPEADEDAIEAGEDLEKDYDDGFGSFDEEVEETKEDGALKTQKSKTLTGLAKLTLLHGATFKDFTTSIDQRPSYMHSIGETKIPKVANSSDDAATLWRRYNQHHMTRTYPAGARVNSSNYDPVLAWSMGCQLVALNFQTSDKNLKLNDGLFRQAGGCGYVPKPSSLMEGGSKPAKINIEITVLSARCIPKPDGAASGEVIDPYIQIDLHDIRVSETSGSEELAIESFKTPTIDNNGLCPVWDKEKATTKLEIHNVDVAMIHFRVIDEDIGADDKLCSSAIPVKCLRQGYRTIHLYDNNNLRTGAFDCATLFVHIKI